MKTPCVAPEELLRWIADGPIQDPSGGIYSWRCADDSVSYVYPEISGYLLTLLAKAGRRTGRERASKCAAFLADRVRTDQLGARRDEESVVYNFDLGMIATGLLRAHGAFREDVVGESLHLVSLCRDQILRDGFLKPVCDRGDMPTRGRKWSTVGSLHLIKCVQPLLLADENGLRGAREAADILMKATMAALEPCEIPVTCPGTPETHLHPVLYCAEGLWIYAMATGNAEAMRHSKQLLAFVVGQMDDMAAMPASIGGPADAPEQCDVLAQALRMGVLHGIEPGILDLMARRLSNFARSFDGFTAMEYISGSGHLNTWATIFAAQAADLFVNGPDVLSWRELA